MSNVEWTQEEIDRFDELIDAISSPQQLVRINGRLDMAEFMAKHGEEKCNAMWRHLEGSL